MPDDPKDVLHRYLQVAREVLLWKLDGLSEYDMRRPMTPTGTNLLGIVKHVAAVEFGYFGDCFGRPSGEDEPWSGPDAQPNDDMWATADESSDEIKAYYRRAWAHADETIAANDLEATVTVPWWGDRGKDVSLQRLLVHVVAETHRHAGHADIVRELTDGSAGVRESDSNLPPDEMISWPAYHAKLEAAARDAQERTQKT